jgi:hypothetical protein
MDRKSAIILIVSVAVACVVTATVFAIVRRHNGRKKTGRGLVRYARSQLGRPYWWGTSGQTATQELLEQKRRQYPNVYGSADYADAEQQLGQRVHDCAGLVEAYMWSDGTRNGKVVPGSNGFPDTTADAILATAIESGTIATIPEIPGLTVHKSGHVGVYAGHGKVIEAKGHRYGVVMTDLATGNWQNWAKVKGIEY